MEDCMRECMRKLCLWVTRTFKPVMSHDELEPIMATLGFVGLPPSSAASGCDWKEYVYSAGGWRRSLSLTIIDHQNPPPPSPRLPYPRIDGLHIYTYTAFLDAVNFYLEMTNMSDLFHIRGMPLHRVLDRNRKWRRIEEDDSVFVYREGTLDQAIYTYYHKNKSDINSGSKGCNSMLIRNKGNSTPTGCIVPLKDIIV
ncbi:hypothetical protein ACSBR2_019751 [Camellia fascicularis]